MNNIDILYYDYMAEMVSENRKIMEFTIGSSIEMKSIMESSDLVIYEGKVIDTIVNSIKEIFKKVIEFFRNLFKKVTSEEMFKPDEKLIKACNEKLKNMSKEDKDNFFVEGISIRGELIYRQDKVNDMIEGANREIEVLYKRSGTLSDKDFEEINDQKNVMDEFSKELDENINYVMNKEEMMKNAKDIDIITVELCLDPSRSTYANSKQTLEKAKSVCNDMEKRMKKYEQDTDKFIKRARNEMKTEVLNDYRSTIYLYTSAIMKLNRTLISLAIMQFKNEEQILRKFIAYNPSSSKQESVTYFDRLLESFIYDEYVTE